MWWPLERSFLENKEKALLRSLRNESRRSWLWQPCGNVALKPKRLFPRHAFPTEAARAGTFLPHFPLWNLENFLGVLKSLLIGAAVFPFQVSVIWNEAKYLDSPLIPAPWNVGNMNGHLVELERQREVGALKDRTLVFKNKNLLY